MRDLPAEWSDWEIVGELGYGSYAVVYEIRRKDNPEMRAAVKVIEIPQEPSELNGLLNDGFDLEQAGTYFEKKVRDFTQEIRVMVRLRETRNIVRIEDYKVVPKENGIGSLIFIRMELLVPLDDYLCGREVSEDTVIRIGTDICSALNVCARADIIHRDVKPGNILVSGQSDEAPVFKLGDFGIARRLESRTGSMSMKGTPAFIAPEVFSNGPYDSRADIYSLGLTLYRLLNGNRLPFYPVKQIYTHEDQAKAFDARISGKMLPPPVNASEALAKVILKACAFRPEDRYATVQEFMDALMNVRNNKGNRHAGRKINGRILLVCACSAAALILLFSVLLSLWGHVNEDADESYYRTAEIEGGVAITGYTGEKTVLRLPAEWRGQKVLQVGDGSGSGFTSGTLETVVIPEGVTTIESGFFSGAVRTVFFPSTVTSVSEAAFTSAVELTRIEVAERNPVLYSVDGVLFEAGSDRLILYPRGRSLQAYIVPEGTKAIGKGAFRNAAVGSVELPSTITAIEDDAFANSMLSGISLPEGLRTIGSRAFENTVLRTVKLPSTLTEVGEGAYAGCRDLTALAIGKNTSAIGDGAFAGTRVSLTVDKNNRNFSIRDGCLIDTGSARLLYCFLDAKAVHIPEGVRVIAGRAFEGAEYLEIHVPESVNAIGRSAFSGCAALMEFTVPQAVTRLESRVFSGCASLKSVTVPSTVTVIEPNCFENCSPDLVLFAWKNTVASAFAEAYGLRWTEPGIGFVEVLEDLMERLQNGGE